MATMRIEIKKISKGGSTYPRFSILSIAVSLPQTATPTVNMSRHGDGCPTAITSLASHNNDAPGFEDEGALDDYLGRVMADVDAAMVAWVAGVYDGPTVEEAPKEKLSFSETMQAGYKALMGQSAPAGGPSGPIFFPTPSTSSFGGTKVVFTAAELGIPDSYKDDILKVPKLAMIPADDIDFDVDEYRRRDDGKWELIVPPTKSVKITTTYGYGEWAAGKTKLWTMPTKIKYKVEADGTTTYVNSPPFMPTPKAVADAKSTDYGPWQFGWSVDTNHYAHKFDICSLCGETWLKGHAGYECDNK